MPLQFIGSVIPGFGAARGAVAAQLPRLLEIFPEMAGVYPGTINVHLERVTATETNFLGPSLLVLHPDDDSGDIVWEGTTERFGIVQIELECPLGDATRKAWIYLPQHSPHRSDFRFVEILAPRIEIEGGLIGRQCQFVIPRDDYRFHLTITL